MDTIDGSDAATSYGTSFAAPLVTGVAALLFSAYPQATAAQVKAGDLRRRDGSCRR